MASDPYTEALKVIARLTAERDAAVAVAVDVRDTLSSNVAATNNGGRFCLSCEENASDCTCGGSSLPALRSRVGDFLASIGAGKGGTR